MGKARSWWGWGWQEDALDDAAVATVAEPLAGIVGSGPGSLLPPPPVPDLPAPRVRPPAALAQLCSAAPADRARHALGRAYRDVARALRGDVPHPPDLVVRPVSEHDVVAVLDWCAAGGIAAVPYGGGSSVVGGVEPDVGDGYAGVISVDLKRLGGVADVDAVSRAAHVEAGAYGPALEEQLRPHGLTLRHFPQSFEFSTLGGWIATRSAGHYATGPTHIEDHVQAVRMVTPAGLLATRRLPASGAGPDPDRLVAGSEGTLGIITSAWVRVRPRPEHRAGAVFHFADRTEAVAAVRDVARSGLQPATLRLLDAGEAAMFAGVRDGSHVLLLGFESGDVPVDGLLAQARDLFPGEERAGGAGGRWRESFLRAPYLRDGLARLGLILETFETACTWDRLDAFHEAVAGAALGAVQRVAGGGLVTSRFTHAYPDGVAPYYTVIAPGRPGAEVAMWDEIKAEVSAAILAAGGTITHHHAVGRVHRAGYHEEAPGPWLAALRAAKAALDPAGIMNPGALL